MRFDDRVTGKLATYAPSARRRSTSRSIPPRSTRTSRSTSRSSATSREMLARAACRGSRRATATPWVERIDELKGDSRGARHPAPARRRAASTPRTSSTICGGSPRARRSSSPTSASTRCGRRSTTSTTTRGSSHLGRPRHDGLRAAGRDRRALRVPGRGGLGRRRRRRLPDDRVRAVDRARRRASRSTSRSSTTATSAWSASGSSSSTAGATRRRRCASPDFVKLAEAHGLTGLARHQARARSRARSQPRARRPGRSSSTSASSRRTASTRWSPAGADLARHDPPARARSSRPRRTNDRARRDRPMEPRHDARATCDTFIALRRGSARRAEPHRVAVPAAQLQHRVAHRRPHRTSPASRA